MGFLIEQAAATVESIHLNLSKRKETLSVAESCTGGLVAAHLTERPGISEVFLGGIVSYGNDIKRDLLHVSGRDLKEHGAVSQTVALKMARGVREQLKSDWSVSITGIAGPGGGTPNKPVGTVWFAVVGPNLEKTHERLFKGDRTTIRRSSVQFALEFLDQQIKMG